MAEDREEFPGFTIKKKVDDSWKDSVQKEKAHVSREAREPHAAAQPDPLFQQFLSTLGMQALMALGEAQDPLAGDGTVDLAQAKYLIDVLQSLAAKTKSNLSPEEEKMFEGLLYELRVKFVEHSKRAQGGTA